jgi:hypothetical protein
VEKRLARLCRQAGALERGRVEIEQEIRQAAAERERAHVLFKVSAYMASARKFGIDSAFYL